LSAVASAEETPPRSGSAQVLGALEDNSYRCQACGFIQTEQPYWLERAYEQPIGKTDVGIISRNMTLADKASAVISMLFDSRGRFLDWGGGYGILVRLMRDRGFDFYWRDPFCENLSARGFEWIEGSRAEGVTAFEVLEHLLRPVDDVARMAEVSDNLLVSTQVLPEPTPAPGDWWYYALEGGQHVSLYSHRSLAVMAGQLGDVRGVQPRRQRPPVYTFADGGARFSAGRQPSRSAAARLFAVPEVAARRRLLAAVRVRRRDPRSGAS
jgi:Methyltransferase domain